MREPERKRISPLRLLILLAAVGVFCYAGLQLLDYGSENLQAEQENQALIDQAVVVLEPTAPQTGEENPEQTQPTGEQAPIRVDFDILREQNPDIIGWIYSPDTPINYPIAQSEDNDYYLRRLTDGTRNTAGTIFVDFRNSADFSDRNTLVYAHNMKNDTMFGTLSEYDSQSYYESHRTLWLLTPERSWKLEPIAGFVTRADSDSYTLFGSREELTGYLHEAVSRSGFESEVDPEQTERIVTLSTCTYQGVDKRYILVCAISEVS